MKRDIIKWTFIGLLIRFLIMPFSFHGHDIFFIYYAPFKFITQGAWDPYLFIKENFPQGIDNPYFPPGLFFIISAFLFLFKFLLSNLHNLFSVFETWNFTWQGNAVHFADIFTDHQLFRTLFLFKIPYLIFDFGIGLFLVQILRSDEKKSLLAYKLWMFNPFVLHSCYALGQIDVISTFFVMAAVYCIYSNRRYWVMLLLTLGILTKTLPILLVPFAILFSADTLKERLKLSLAVIMPLIAIIAPFYLSSKSTIFEALFFSGGGIGSFRQSVFIVAYLGALSIFLFLKRQDKIDLDSVISSFVVVLLLFFAIYIVTIRYFILITPLLIYMAMKNKKFWIYNIIFIVTLFELRAAGNTQQWGLFAALHPEFFSSLPISDSYLNLAINVLYVHKIMYRLFIISSLAMVIHILVILIKRGVFRFSLSRL